MTEKIINKDGIEYPVPGDALLKEAHLPICDLFVSIQGEGKYTGEPSIFIRVSGCNLRCVFQNSICDTAYSSFCPEKGSFTEEDVRQIIKDNPQVNHIVVTGGEPLLYKKELERLLLHIWEDRMVITIETNGTLPMLNPALRFKVALYSVSPKLHTSVPAPGTSVKIGEKDIIFGTEEVETLNKKRINIDNLINIALYANDYQFKFVYSGKGCVKEIEDIYARMTAEVAGQGGYLKEFFQTNHPNKHTMLMPEGDINDKLAGRREECVSECIKHNWRYCERVHVIIWGDKRAV